MKTQIANAGFFLAIIASLSGCARVGMGDLAKNGTKSTLIVSGAHAAIAQCVTEALDREPPRLGEVAAPVTRSVPSADGKSIQLVAGMAALSSAYIWAATFSGDGRQTQISLISRDDVGPFQSSHYVKDKVLRAINGCAAAK